MSEQGNAASTPVLPSKGPALSITTDPAGFFQKNLKFVLGALGVLAVVIAGAFFLRSSSEKKSNEAALALSRVRPYYEQSDWNKALNGDPSKTVRGGRVMGLRSIADQYSGTEAGKVAALYAGTALLAQQKGADAAAYFQKASDSESPSVVAGGTAGLAAARELEGKFTDAAELYERASEIGTALGFEERYTTYAALCYEKAGNKEKAADLFRRVSLAHENTEYGLQAKAGLARLGMKLD